ncbi:MAG: cupin domain-containing protein [Saprospiraceae bacterium]
MLEINQSVHFRALGTTYKVLSESVGGSAAIVEHTLDAKCLGAPMHKHTRENEISFVLEGELSVMQNGEVQIARPGQYIVKPMGIFHTFWNTGDKTVRFIEIITPGNFEYYFAELAPYLIKGQPPQMDKVRETAQKYGLVIDINATAAIIEKYGLTKLP